MQLTIFAIAIALAANPVIAEPGKTWIHNHCDFDVHLWSVDADGSSDPFLLKKGNKFNETIRSPSVGGVSLKLSSDDNCADPITQLEYTITDKLWYDISNVNCEGNDCPFSKDGLYMESGADCPTRACTPGEIPCRGAYTKFNDDWNSLACAQSSDLVLHLCKSSSPSDKDGKATKRAASPWVPDAEYGVPAHRRKARRHHHGHPHVRR